MSRKHPTIDFVVHVKKLSRELPVTEDDYNAAVNSFNDLMQTLPSGRRMRLAGDIARHLMKALVEDWQNG